MTDKKKIEAKLREMEDFMTNLDEQIETFKAIHGTLRGRVVELIVQDLSMRVSGLMAVAAIAQCREATIVIKEISRSSLEASAKLVNAIAFFPPDADKEELTQVDREFYKATMNLFEQVINRIPNPEVK